MQDLPAPWMRCISKQEMTMNHMPNRKQLERGDLVIHDRDAKERRMIRVVVAILPSGLVRTVFQFRKDLPKSWRKRVFYDRPERLLDPRRFGLSTSKKSKEVKS